MRNCLTTLFLSLFICPVFANHPSEEWARLMDKIDVIRTFKDTSVPHFFIDCKDDISVLKRYTHIASGFGIEFYDRKKGDLEKGGNLLVSILRKPFMDYQKNYSNAYKELLGDSYQHVIDRLEKGENFYLFQPGPLNKIFLCGQEKNDIAALASELFSPTFQADALDSDGDGLPDYIELAIGTDPFNPDTDGDGLSDYDEIFKYRTNPLSADSDNDGIPDSEWNERREYAYTIAVKREIYPPYDTCALSDLYQDSRVLSEHGDTLVHETILYPNTIQFVIPSSDVQNIPVHPQAEPYTKPTFFCNFTPQMQQEMNQLIATWRVKDNYDLLASLAQYVIVITTGYPSNEPLNFYIQGKNGKVEIVHRERFEQFKTSHFTTDESVLERLTFGASMYKNRMRGACGSSSILYTSILRASGLPTRIVVSNPILNYTDPAQVDMIAHLQHENYRNMLRGQVRRLGGYANHFFYEVNINGRWVRCDYDNVNIASDHVQGLFVVQNNLLDFTDVDYARTWGQRMVDNRGNAYNTLELSDQFPLHKGEWSGL